MTRTIKVNLSEHIRKLGVNQKEFAEMCNLRPATISQLMTGKYERLQLSHLLAIMDTLKEYDFNEILSIESDDE